MLSAQYHANQARTKVSQYNSNQVSAQEDMKQDVQFRAYPGPPSRQRKTREQLLAESEKKARASEYPWNDKSWRKANNPMTPESIRNYFQGSAGKKKVTSSSSESSDKIDPKKIDLDNIKSIQTRLFSHQKVALKWMLERESEKFF
jgi:hypothetical protein